MEDEIWSKMEELDFAKSSSAVKVLRADNPNGICEIMKIIPGMEIEEVRELAFSLVYPGNGKAPKQTVLTSIDGMDVDDVTLLTVIPEGKLLINPGLNFVDQKAVEAVMLKQEAEKKQKEKEKIKEKRKTRFSSIGRMFGKHKEKEVLRSFKSKAEAIKSYAAEKEDELDFEKGEIFLIDLTSIPEEGWFVAQHHGKIGIVPASFVKVIKEPGADGTIPEERMSSTSLASLAEADQVPVPRTLVEVTCLHDYTGQGDELTFKKADIMKVDAEELSKGEDWVYAELNGMTGYAPIGYIKLGIVDLTEETKTRSWIYAEVLYTYNAQKEDELSMKVGDIILVDNNQEDPAWRVAQMNGKEGYIPNEYLKIVTKEEVKKKASMKLAQIRQEKRGLEEDIRKKKIKDAHALRAKKIRDAELEKRRKEAEEKRLKEEAEHKKAEMVKKALFSRKTMLGGSDDEQEDY